MDAIPDRRWANIIGRTTSDGIEMMSFERLSELAAEWDGIVPPQSAELDGPTNLLRMARSLFAHSWFNYEFMTVACLVGLQAMEASFRALYPEPEGRPLKKLLSQAERDAVLPQRVAELARTAVELRNLYSHPRTQSVLTVGMAVPMLEHASPRRACSRGCKLIIEATCNGRDRVTVGAVGELKDQIDDS